MISGVVALKGREGLRLRVGDWQVSMDDQGNVVACGDQLFACYDRSRNCPALRLARPQLQRRDRLVLRYTIIFANYAATAPC